MSHVKWNVCVKTIYVHTVPKVSYMNRFSFISLKIEVFIIFLNVLSFSSKYTGGKKGVALFLGPNDFLS
jgi:hypothetical protein